MYEPAKLVKKVKKTKPKTIRLQMSEQERRRLEVERRARTNVGNLLLTYLYLRRRSSVDLERLFPEITQEEKDSYYRFIVQLKRNSSGYLNDYRLSLLWNPAPDLEGFNYQIIRVLSHYFLREKLPLSIMTSARMPSSHRA